MMAGFSFMGRATVLSGLLIDAGWELNVSNRTFYSPSGKTAIPLVKLYESFVLTTDKAFDALIRRLP